MTDITTLLSDSGLAKTIMDSLPCGLFVADEEGRVLAVNDVVERVFGVSGGSVAGLGTGNALGCINAVDNPEVCGQGSACEYCEIRNLALSSLSSNQKQRARISFQALIGGQVRDLTLLLSAIPCNLPGSQRFALLIMEDITRLSFLSQPDTDAGFCGMIGRDKRMLAIFDLIKKVAPVDTPVLLQGESGTGKELAALAIHKKGPRSRRHFVPVSCAALPEGLLEAELFGHVRGAFTGAIRDKKGRFEFADGGSIFLDEVGELSPAVQVRLLRVLQDGTFNRLGSEQTISVDVRVISASNKMLEREVAAERFREDLYYRLCGVPIILPPLRDRPGDIVILARYFLSQYAEDSTWTKVQLSAEAAAALRAHTWPGNVRELQHALQFALVKCRGDTILPGHLPPTVLRAEPKTSAMRNRKSKLHGKDVFLAPKKSNGNKRKAAEMLGVSRTTLYRFLWQEKE